MKTSSSILTRSLVEAASRLGMDRDELLKQANVNPALLEDPEARVPEGTHPQMMQVAIAMSGDEQIALRLGESYQIDPTDHLSNLFFNSPHLRAAVENAARFYHFLADDTYLEFSEEGEQATIAMRHVDPKTDTERVIVEWTLSVWARFLRIMIGEDVKFHTVFFRHSKKMYTKRYADYFGGSVQFGQKQDGLIFSAQYLDIPNQTARPTIFEIAKKLTLEKISQLEPQENLVTQVKLELKEMLRGVPPDQKRIANTLGMSARTLQRKLQTHGVTYRGLLEELRKEYSLKLLAGKNASITDIAFYLGYANKTNFYQEFTRWHGGPPGKFKNL